MNDVEFRVDGLDHLLVRSHESTPETAHSVVVADQEEAEASQVTKF